jgi:hypothetical protein
LCKTLRQKGSSLANKEIPELEKNSWLSHISLSEISEILECQFYLVTSVGVQRYCSANVENRTFIVENLTNLQQFVK